MTSLIVEGRAARAVDYCRVCVSCVRSILTLGHTVYQVSRVNVYSPAVRAGGWCGVSDSMGQRFVSVLRTGTGTASR